MFEGGLDSLQTRDLNGKYWRPQALNLPALDSVVVLDAFASRGRCLVGFQATVSATHSLNHSGIAAFLRLATAKGIPESNAIVVFVVPNTEVWGTWQTKQGVVNEQRKAKETEMERGRGKGRRGSEPARKKKKKEEEDDEPYEAPPDVQQMVLRIDVAVQVQQYHLLAMPPPAVAAAVLMPPQSAAPQP